MAKENIKEFTNEVMETVEDVAEETTERVEQKQNWLIKKWNGLKLWQKIAVVVLLTGSIAGGIAVIYNLIKKDPKAVAEAIETVTENPEVVADAVENSAEVVNL